MLIKEDKRTSKPVRVLYFVFTVNELLVFIYRNRFWLTVTAKYIKFVATAYKLLINISPRRFLIELLIQLEFVDKASTCIVQYSNWIIQ